MSPYTRWAQVEAVSGRTCISVWDVNCTTLCMRVSILWLQVHVAPGGTLPCIDSPFTHPTFCSVSIVSRSSAICSVDTNKINCNWQSISSLTWASFWSRSFVDLLLLFLELGHPTWSTLFRLFAGSSTGWARDLKALTSRFIKLRSRSLVAFRYFSLVAVSSCCKTVSDSLDRNNVRDGKRDKGKSTRS